MFADGTRYRVDNGLVTSIRDRNGNVLTFTYGTDPTNAITYQRLINVTDSLNRQVSISYADNSTVFYDQINFKGFGGAPRTLRVWYSSLGQVLRPGYSLSNYYHLFPEYASNSFPPDPNDPNLYNPTVVSSLELPDGRRYQFLYNSYSELARVVVPTGGAVEYDHTPTSGVVCYNPNNCSAGTEIYRRTEKRRVYADGTSSTPESRTTYSSLTTSGGLISANPVTMDHLNAAGTLLAREQHYFFGNAVPSSSLVPVYWSPWNSGKEYQTDYLSVVNGVAGSLLRRNTSTWQQRAPVSWCTSQFGCTPDSAPPNDPRMVETVSTLADTNQVTKTTSINPQTGTVGFDQFNNPTDSWTYDYGPGGPGALLRHTHSDYLTVNPINGIDYTNRTNSTSPHVLSLPKSQSVFDASEIEQARTTFEYDNYGYATYHAPLVPRSLVSGFDPGFDASYSTRGNVTGTTSYLLTNGTVTGSVSNYAQYDIVGNAVKAIDAKGNVTDFEFTDRYGSPNGEAQAPGGSAELASQGSYAFATKVTNPLGHITYTQFDFYTGKPVDGEDANGIVSSGYSVNDFLDRPTTIIRAVNTSARNQTVFAYDDTGRTITTSSDLDTNGDGALVSKVLYDGLGRTTETRQYEGGTNYIATQQQYDPMGRAYKTSNPFRPWQSESAVWTTAAFDSLSRVISVTTPDSAVVGTSYSGNTVTVTDQAGKKRKNLTDGLGRLKEVYEDPTALNYLTSYSYDALDNLTTVSQGVQTRTFVYDSLRRLASAANPESGTINYVYDNNGNLSIKTDARGVSSHYDYDALNRAKRRWYNGSNLLTATVNNSPALPSGVAATDEVNYFYDSSTLPATPPPNFDRGYATGRLVAVTYGGGSSGTYFGYDALGRTVRSTQQTGSINYQTSATYNAAGGFLTETYPSGRMVTDTYDGAGRTASVVGTLGDATNRTYSTGILYSPFGGIKIEQFGTDTAVYNKLQYNIRGQLWDVRVSTGADPNGTWNRGVLQFFYDQAHTFGGSNPDNNGNVTQMKHYRPLDDSSATWAISTDTYSYDPLNRISSVSENFVSTSQADSQQFVQSYVYDRYGNRTIDPATWGTGINNKQFTVTTTNNRLTVPNGQSGTMNYDNAGNLTTDSYSSAALTRAYDAENRMTSETQAGPIVVGSYIYDADGQRVRHTVNGTEKWQVYGIGGELVAEYPVNGATTTPEKEYGYRNGRLLITAEPAAQINWLVVDQIGTPRIIVAKTGALANVKRHDYLPFGEELLAGQGGRSISNGHSGDNIHQKFTSKEWDIETGLDYFGARYYGSTQGRFTSPDEFKGGPHALWVLGSGDPEKQALVYADITNPQSLNKYQYTFNNPLRYVDPDGQAPQDSFDNRINQLIRQQLKGEINEKQYWENLRGAAAGTAAGLAIIVAARGGGQILTALGMWASRNPDKVEQIAQAMQEGAGGPPGLTLGPSSRLTATEISTGGRLAKQLGVRLEESAHVGAEYVVAGANKTIDAMGGGQAYQHFGNGSKFFESIVHHVNKSVDYVAIDLAGASKSQVKAVQKFVTGLSEEQRKKIVYVQ
jgi:RHS repeat-associated protein